MGSIWSRRYFSIKWQRCWSKNSTSVADPGEEPPPRRPPPPNPLVLDQTEAPRAEKKMLWHRPPPPQIWRSSGSATELTPLNLNDTRNSLSLVPLKASMFMRTFQVYSMFTGNHTSRTADEGVSVKIYTNGSRSMLCFSFSIWFKFGVWYCAILSLKRAREI